MKYISDNYYEILKKAKDNSELEFDRLRAKKNKLKNKMDNYFSKSNEKLKNIDIFLNKYEACLNLITIEKARLNLLEDFIKNLDGYKK